MATSYEQSDRLIAEWIAAASQGDDAACMAIYERFVHPVYRLVFGILLDEQDTEEVVQDSFVYAFKRLSHFDPSRSAFRTWLYTIAISRCRNKRRRKWLPTVTLAEIAEWAVGWDGAPEQEVMSRQARRDLLGALKQLSPKLREAIILRYFGGLSYREMADTLGCPQKTAESRVRLAHEAMHSLLKDQSKSLIEAVEDSRA